VTRTALKALSADVEAANGKVKGEVGRAQFVASDLARLHAAKITVCEEVEQPALEATAAKARSLSATIARIDSELTKSLAAMRKKLAPLSSMRAKDDVNPTRSRRMTWAGSICRQRSSPKRSKASGGNPHRRSVLQFDPIPPLFAEVSAPPNKVAAITRRSRPRAGDRQPQHPTGTVLPLGSSVIASSAHAPRASISAESIRLNTGWPRSRIGRNFWSY
jgi:hypothetical protein